MKYSQYPESTEVSLTCSCGQTFTGTKRNSHSFVATHRECVLTTGRKLDLTIAPRKQELPRDPMEQDTDQGPQEIEWSDARAIRAQLAGA